MFFKNVRAYRLTGELPSVEELESAFSEYPSNLCTPTQLSTTGFARAGHTENLIHTVNGMHLVRVLKHERVLPAAVIKDALDKKIAEIEKNESRKVYGKEKKQLKEDIVFTLTRQAFQRSKSTYAAIDMAAGLIYVDAFSAGAAEEVLSLMRSALGSLPVRPVSAKMPLNVTATNWIRGVKLPDSLKVGETFKLSDDVSRVNAKHYSTHNDSVQELVNDGMSVEQIELHWQDKLTFLLDESFAIKRLAFSGTLLAQASDDAGENSDVEAYFDASFVLMMLTMREFIPSMLHALGGENIPE